MEEERFSATTKRSFKKIASLKAKSDARNDTVDSLGQLKDYKIFKIYLIKYFFQGYNTINTKTNTKDEKI